MIDTVDTVDTFDTVDTGVLFSQKHGSLSQSLGVLFSFRGSAWLLTTMRGTIKLETTVTI